MTTPDIPEDIRFEAANIALGFATKITALQPLINCISEALLSERNRAREEAFEEAAKIADCDCANWCDRHDVAAEIRASIRTEGTKP